MKLAAGVWILHRGFTHISDDDYARTVIAEQFAHSPRLDPSATSWLPLPFWLEGGAMLASGDRSLGAARAVAVVVGAAAVALPYQAMVGTGVARAAAWIATAVCIALPWNAWLGVATVPEGWVGALVAAAAIAMPAARARPWVAAALLAASLSRYEAWPVCAVMAAVCSLSAARGQRPGREIACAALAAAGPIAWMLWNRHAHGSAIHFLARVSAFRHAIGAADIPLKDKLLGYPRALAGETPEAVALGIAGAAGAVMNEALRARWRIPALIAAATLAFLVAGDLSDGAPTHHPARALAPIWWLLVGAGIDAAWQLGRRMATGGTWARQARWVAMLFGLAWLTGLPSRWSAFPGLGEWDRRDVQIVRGLELRSRSVAWARIVPCSFEHFALLAAWGAPERAEVTPRTGEPPTSECPRVIER
jgi:hypothetical protein